MEHEPSKSLLITLGIMVCVFSLVTLFKSDVYKEDFVKYVLDHPVKPGDDKRKIAEESKKKPFEIIDRRIFTSTYIEIERDRGRKVSSDDLLITFPKGTDPMEVETLENSYNLSLRYYNPRVGVAHFKIPFGHRMARQDLEKIIPSKSPLVIAVEPNILIEPDVLTDLPKEHSSAWLWYFYNDGQPKSFSTGIIRPKLHFDIFWGNLITPWNLWTLQSNCKSLIAVVDGGFDTYHEMKYDLAKSKNVTCSTTNSILAHLSSEQEKCYATGEHRQLLKDLANINITSDDVRKEAEKTMIHGHQVSGTIAAIVNNNQDGAGLCPHADSKVIPILLGKLQRDQNNKIIYAMFSSDLALGIEAASDVGAKVINASVGFTDPNTYSCSNQLYSSPCHLVSSVEYARSKNTLVIFPAGNKAQDNDLINRSPTNLSQYFDNVLSIAASSPNGNLWVTKDSNGNVISGSNYGVKNVNLMAPGEFIYTPNFSSQFINTIPSEYNTQDRLNDTGYFSNRGTWGRGTSLSAPITAAIAGLVYEMLLTKFESSHPLNQYNYASAVKNILLKKANAKSSDCVDKDKVSNGCLDAFEAFNYTKHLIDTDNSSELISFSGGVASSSVSGQSTEEQGGDGGGCGFIDHSNNSSGNWPILIFYLVLMIRLLLNIRRLQLLFVRGSFEKDRSPKIKPPLQHH